MKTSAHTQSTMPRPRKWFPFGYTVSVDKRGRLRTRIQRLSAEDMRVFMRLNRTLDQGQDGGVSTQQQEERDTFQDIPLASSMY